MQFDGKALGIVTQSMPLRTQPVVPMEHMHGPEPEIHRPTHSRIASSERVSLPVEITLEIILTFAFMVALDELLD